MIHNRQKSLFSLFILLFLFICIFSAHSGGQTEKDPMEEAQALYEEGRYDNAILILTEFIRDNPDRLPEAEELMDKIRAVRSDFNQVLEELMGVFDDMRNRINLNENAEKAVNLIDRLKEIDPNPNRKTQSFVVSLSATANLVYNEAIFTGIMIDAANLIEQGRYYEAISTYLKGTSLHREDFINAQLGNIIEDSVENAVSAIENNSQKMVGIRNALEEERSSVMNALSQKSIVDLVSNLDDFSTMIQNVEDNGYTIENAANNIFDIRERTQFSDSDIQIAAKRYLTYLIRLVRGRDDVNRQEGIAACIDYLSKKQLDTVIAGIKNFASEVEQSADNEFNLGNWEIAIRSYNNAREVYQAEFDAIRLHELSLRFAPTLSLQSNDEELVNDMLSDFFTVQSKIKSMRTMSNLSEIELALHGAQDLPSATLAQLRNKRSVIQQLRSEILQIQSSWNEISQLYLVKAQQYLEDENEREIATTKERIDDRLFNIEQQEIAVVNRVAQIQKNPIVEDYEDERETISRARELKTGVLNEYTNADGETLEIESKYPSRALDIFQNSLGILRDIRNRSNDFLNTYRNELEYIASSDPIRGQIADMAALRDSIITLEDEISILIQESQNQIQLAEEEREEGFLHLEEARAALENDNFDRARNLLSDAQNNFFVSLNNQEDFDFRRESDNLILTLNDAIINRQNQLIVIEVNELVEEARNLYLRDNFARAEQVLREAESLWFSTNVDQNPKINRWLTLVSAALNAQSGRTITENDPLFGVMVSILNLAREDYNRAREFFDSGNEEEAMRLLEAAEEKIQKVILQFPFNQEARVLSLKIEELRNPANFQVLFRERFEEAISNLNQNPNEAYADLLDLKTIRPNYPGMEDALYRAELILGIREPPPDQAKIAESNRLYESAQRIVDRNIRAQFPVAIEQLNRALELYPDNREALALWDQLQIGLGGQTSVVLSSVAMEQYRKAEQYAINGDDVLALNIIRRLLSDPENQGYPPLQRLNETVSLRLGLEVQ